MGNPRSVDERLAEFDIRLAALESEVATLGAELQARRSPIRKQLANLASRMDKVDPPQRPIPPVNPKEA